MTDAASVKTVLPIRQNAAVNDPIPAYLVMADRWALPFTLFAGTKAMRAAGTTYLPKFKKETDDLYNDRLSRTFLFNALKKTIKDLVGKPLGKTIVLNDATDEVKGWMGNVDLTGRDLNMFMGDVFTNALKAGLSHILADYPTMPLGATLDDVRRLKARPYLYNIGAEDLIGWRITQRGNVPVLSQIRFRQTVTKPDGAYGEREVRQVRVIFQDMDPGGSTSITRFEVWEEPEPSQAAQGSSAIAPSSTRNWTMVNDGMITPSVIALSTAYTERKAFMMAEPPLSDLADLNLEHWQSSSDQRNILHVARVPVLFGQGFGPDDKLDTVGPSRMFLGPAGSTLQYVEHTGAAIGAGRQDLLDLEDRMMAMGLSFVMRQAANQTATGKSIDADSSDSRLHQMVDSLRDAGQRAVEFMCQFADRDPKDAGQMEINKDFGINVRSMEAVAQLIRARATGDISQETFLRELQRYSVLDAKIDVTAEIERAAEDAARAAAAEAAAAGAGE